MTTMLVTGASRGIGREFVRQYDEAGWTVIPTCRDPKAAGYGGEALALDVIDPDSIAAAARAVEGRSIDLLINNAGIAGPKGYDFGSIDFAAWEHVLRVNTLGPLRVAEAFVDAVARSERKLMVFVSSIMGSIAENEAGRHYMYRSSKAGLNAAVKSLSIDLKPRGITCVVVHPGWVQTDMGGPEATIDAGTSVSGLRRAIDRLGPRDTGKFFGYDGKELPW